MVNTRDAEVDTMVVRDVLSMCASVCASFYAPASLFAGSHPGDFVSSFTSSITGCVLLVTACSPRGLEAILPS